MIVKGVLAVWDCWGLGALKFKKDNWQIQCL